MTEYIDREKALKIFAEYNEEVSPFIDEDSDSLSRWVANRELREKIRNLPAEDVAPVVYAKWLTGEEIDECWSTRGANKYLHFCSNCHEQAMDISDDVWSPNEELTSCCPWCGAKMVRNK